MKLTTHRPISTWKAIDRFSPLTAKLRSRFDETFKNPLQTHEERFIWDVWHIPGQYHLNRTPAESFFGPKLYKELTSELKTWGQKNLGCAQISPVWLSYYIEGCEQKLHCDNGHGPWAFVWSLTPNKRRFRGGQTKILRPEILNYWKNHQYGQGLEESQIFDLIEPEFGRLTVFDPRLPHGVNRVDGVQDPREARLVLHGWFTQPEPIVSKGLLVKSVQSQLADLIRTNALLFEGSENVTGVLSFELKVLPNGRISRVLVLTQNLQSRDGNTDYINSLIAKIAVVLKTWTFSRGAAGRFLIIPLVFE